ncbi:MAG TPA: hypothetical protein VGQ36_10650 [Thermoanaerobaculia bacterium]|jgi:hypothetical protein|nr:hypothetical protein [Thermoanaerobaculia bacterium]
MRTFTVVVCSLVLLSCHYDFPLTAEPTRAADARLAGTWTLVEPEQGEKMDIRLYDDRHYVVAYNGEIYRAFHSDLAGMPLMSVQSLNDPERKYVVLEWKLSEDGKRLTIRVVSPDVVPEGTPDRDALVKLIESNRENPKLFGEPGVYVK